MKLKQKKVSELWISQLSDWEILSAFLYCSKILNRSCILSKEEFDDICFFFFDDNEIETIEYLNEIKQLYFNEYTKRHIN